ncbi:MAG: hypothetical protein ABH919_03210 [bacterium]
MTFLEKRNITIRKKIENGQEVWMVTENGQTKYYTADSLPEDIKKKIALAKSGDKAKKSFTIKTKDGIQEYKSFNDLPGEYKKLLREKGINQDEIGVRTKIGVGGNGFRIVFYIIIIFLFLLILFLK